MKEYIECPHCHNEIGLETETTFTITHDTKGKDKSDA
jgi:hypothetical protein